MAADALRTLRASGRHEFWADEVTVTHEAVFDVEVMVGYQQLTDVYQRALAVKRGGTLATFDRRIPLAAVKRATREHLAVLAAAV